MKPRFSNQRNRALTRIEVLIIVGVASVLLCLALTWFAQASRKAGSICCNCNLKEVGTAYRIYAQNNDNKYPMQVAVKKGGAMELTATGNVAACFPVMSNSLADPKVLICPRDAKRTPATSFSGGFNNNNVSYFVGLDANLDHPQMFLSGDDNFAIGGMPVKSGLLELSTNTPITWTAARHRFFGNICLADGSVQQFTTDDLQQALQQTGIATNRLAIP